MDTKKNQKPGIGKIARTLDKIIEGVIAQGGKLDRRTVAWVISSYLEGTVHETLNLASDDIWKNPARKQKVVEILRLLQELADNLNLVDDR